MRSGSLAFCAQASEVFREGSQPRGCFWSITLAQSCSTHWERKSWPGDQSESSGAQIPAHIPSPPPTHGFLLRDTEIAAVSLAGVREDAAWKERGTVNRKIPVSCGCRIPGARVSVNPARRRANGMGQGHVSKDQQNLRATAVWGWEESRRRGTRVVPGSGMQCPDSLGHCRREGPGHPRGRWGRSRGDMETGGVWKEEREVGGTVLEVQAGQGRHPGAQRPAWRRRKTGPTVVRQEGTGPTDPQEHRTRPASQATCSGRPAAPPPSWPAGP